MCAGVLGANPLKAFGLTQTTADLWNLYMTRVDADIQPTIEDHQGTAQPTVCAQAIAQPIVCVSM